MLRCAKEVDGHKLEIPKATFLANEVEADAANPQHVVTVRGLGYRLQS